MAGEAGLLVLAWGLGRWLDILPWQRLHFSAEAVALGAVATLPMLLGLAWILTTRWPAARRLVDLVLEQLGPVLAERSTLQLALLALLAGVGEELLFRGVVQVGLDRVLSHVGGLVAASTIFGLMHFASPTYALLAGVVGLYLGALFLFQGNLLVPIVAHSLYDFVALVYVVRRYRARQVVPLGC